MRTSTISSSDPISDLQNWRSETMDGRDSDPLRPYHATIKGLALIGALLKQDPGSISATLALEALGIDHPFCALLVVLSRRTFDSHLGDIIRAAEKLHTLHPSDSLNATITQLKSYLTHAPS